MSNTYLYRAYDLNIQSDWALPSLVNTEFAEPDLTIRHTKISPFLDDYWQAHHVTFRNWQAIPGKFFMKIHGVADFLAIEGNTILIERAHQQVEDDAVYAYLMGSIMAAILQQRKLTLLHASAVQMHGGAAVFAGRSGAGKSTLAVKMMDKGYALISDDVVALQKNNATEICATPSYPSARLGEDALKELSFENNAMKRVRPELDKFHISAISFCPTLQPVKVVYILNPENKNTVRIERVATKDAHHEITTHGFRNRFLKGHRGFAEHFQTMMELATKVPMYKVYRPTHQFAIEELSEALIAHNSTILPAP